MNFIIWGAIIGAIIGALWGWDWKELHDDKGKAYITIAWAAAVAIAGTIIGGVIDILIVAYRVGIAWWETPL